MRLCASSETRGGSARLRSRRREGGRWRGERRGTAEVSARVGLERSRIGKCRRAGAVVGGVTRGTASAVGASRTRERRGSSGETRADADAYLARTNDSLRRGGSTSLSRGANGDGLARLPMGADGRLSASRFGR
jgi:hypothetical protein